MSMTDDGAIPRMPLCLGAFGLVPFWGLAMAVLLQVGPIGGIVTPATALATYGAVILSFLGGIRWGVALVGRSGSVDYLISIVASLAGWALLAVPDPWRLLALGLVICAWGPLDLVLVSCGSAPRWFGRLRLILSTGAGVALLLAAF